MLVAERTILGWLIAEAEREGFRAVRIGCHPSERDPDEVLHGERLTAEECVRHARAFDAHSVLEFEDPTGAKAPWWALLIWGNGEDVLSDYTATADARRVCDRVYAQIEGRIA